MRPKHKDRIPTLLASSQERVAQARRMIACSSALVARSSRWRVQKSANYLVAQDRQWAELRQWLDGQPSSSKLPS